jgi:CubicO group peptidase (beta-lactamase class C family)
MTTELPRLVTEGWIRRTGSRFLLSLLVVSLACSSTPTDSSDDPDELDQEPWSYTQLPVTGDGWETGTLTDANIDLPPLEAAIQGIRDDEYPRIHSLLIFRHGRLVFEEYFRGWVYQNPQNLMSDWVLFDRDRIHQMASVTKSVTSTLAGIAIEEGLIESEDVPIHTFFPEYADDFDEQKRRITIRHLLDMEGGWAWTESVAWNSTNLMYNFVTNPDPLRYLIRLDMAGEPGTVWAYNGAAVTLLGKIIEKASGRSLDDYSGQALFGPLGLTAGQYPWPYINANLIAAHGDLKLRPRDMGKLGQLFLDGGVWQGQRLISQEWVERAGASAMATGYGYLWWGDRYWSGGPTYDSFSAQGWGGQRIIVFPGLDMVVVFTGGNYESWDPADQIVENHILPAVLVEVG